jgi:tRNA dimethylallyltransferase
VARLPVSRFFMPGVFFIVGPTAVGKSALAAEVAEKLDAEIVNADAFQIYCGLDVLTGKPDARTQERAPHHLLGSVPLSEMMSAAKFCASALRTLAGIRSRGKNAIVVGGSGLYVKALTHGFNDVPPPNPELRAQLNGLPLKELVSQLQKTNPKLASRVDLKNQRRITRALEIALGAKNHSPIGRNGVAAVGIGSGQISAAKTAAATRGERPGSESGVLLIRDRDDLYDRINNRVNAMFHRGVEKEVRTLTEVGLTAARALGLRQLQRLIAGEVSRDECIAQIQQATRRYAKRQLTWFRHQSNFPQLNLTPFSHQEAVSAILQMAQRHLARE